MQCYSREDAGDCQWQDDLTDGDQRKAQTFLSCYAQAGGSSSEAMATCCAQTGGGCYRSPSEYEANRAGLCGQ
jgi:hypothetical protein